MSTKVKNIEWQPKNKAHTTPHKFIYLNYTKCKKCPAGTFFYCDGWGVFTRAKPYVAFVTILVRYHFQNLLIVEPNNFVAVPNPTLHFNTIKKRPAGTFFYCGGWGGIRTPGSLAASAVFKTVAFDHSATHPKLFSTVLSNRRFW